MTVRFLLVGLFNTAFGYLLFAALHLAVGDRVHYLLVLLAAHVLTVLTAFCLYGRYVFADGADRGLAALARFWSVYLVGLGLNALVLLIGVELLGLAVLLAQTVALVVTATVSFIGHSRFSFRQVAAP